MKKSKVFLLATVGLLSVGVLTACSSSSKTSGKTYNYVYGGDPATLDYVSTNKKNMTTAVSNGVDGLFENDQYGNLKPSVAENWSVSAPDKGTIQLDHGLVLTVAENLIGNAARFAKSKIEIHLERKGNFLHLSVTDDGPGYPVELIQSGPKPFGKMKEDSAHFGMGLYSSQILCLKHGGTLTLENSKSYGATATASFQINQKP